MFLHPLVVENGFLTGAVATQGTFFTRGVGPYEDPVLPGGEPAEDLGLTRLGADEPVIGCHPGERVRAERGPPLDDDADLVLPIEVVRRVGDQPEIVGLHGGAGRAGTRTNWR